MPPRLLRNEGMSTMDGLWLLGFVGLWLVLPLYVLPKLGVPT